LVNQNHENFKHQNPYTVFKIVMTHPGIVAQYAAQLNLSVNYSPSTN